MITRLALAIVLLFFFNPEKLLSQTVNQSSPSSNIQSGPGAEITDNKGANTPQEQSKAAGEAAILDATKAPQNQDPSGHGKQAAKGVGADEITHENNESTIANFTVALAVATTLLAVATFGLALSTRGLHRETRRLADEAVNQGEKTERQIKLLEESTTQAARAAQAAIDSLSGERAWVLFDGIEFGQAADGFIDGIPKQNMLVCQPSFINLGRSPALNLQVWRDHRVIPFGDSPPNFTVGEMGEAHGFTIGPNAKIQSNYVSVPDPEHTSIIKREKKLIIYLMSSYNVMSSLEERKHTEVCIEIVFAGEKEVNGLRMPHFNVGPVGAQNLTL